LAWEDKTDALGDARADVTWDEESYNQYLDRHVWYERDQRQLIKRSKKESNRPLLDMIE